MKEKDVLEICSAVMIQGDDAVFRGLAVMGEMMDAVVNSDLCEKAGARLPLGKAILRTDEVKAEFSRDDMLAGAIKRSGDFAVVPKVIE
jgi:Asp-tRNA(Asn)/Glu-tRNA(Gln) amidotransferase C subunit